MPGSREIARCAGRAFRRVRIRHGFTGEQLAEASGVPVATIRDLERGLIPPTVVNQLAKLFDEARDGATPRPIPRRGRG